MQKIIRIRTDKKNGLYDITGMCREIVEAGNIREGICNIYVLGATAGIMIQENWDESVQHDVVSFLKDLVPAGIWEHDHQDNNGDAHLKAGLIGPSENVPVIKSKLGLSTWQNIFLCEFDGPRAQREVVVTVIPA
jgi:secondary thiamine-phosphate synthase enzyme